MVNVLFPIAARAQQRAQDGEEDGEQPRRKRRAESNLHSTDLWHLPGGATGDECYYEIVKEETLARRARESEAAQRKAARAETRKSARALANELGSNICRNLQSDADMKKLKVPELKAALLYPGVAVDPASNLIKNTELTALLAHELRGSDCSAPAILLVL